MAQLVGKHVSPRHGFRFDHVPTRRGSIYGGSCVVHYPDSYASILDSVFEMARDVRDANAWDVGMAIDQVLKDEGWTILPRHRKVIVTRLADA